MDEFLFTEEQAAERLNVSRRTLQGWRQRGVGPEYTKLGELVRYKPSKLQAYTDQNARMSTCGASA